VNIETWLSEATGSFPAGVQQRLAQEYRAHWEESGGGGDVAALFGKPGVVRRRLKRLYFDAQQFQRLQENPNSAAFLFVPLLIALGLGRLGVGLFGIDSGFLAIVSVVVGAGLWLIIWALTRPWPAVRRDSTRIMGHMVVATAMQFPAIGWGNRITNPALGVLLLFAIATLFFNDAKVRRTLALEGQCG
jgi:hypothetical protein